MIRRHGGIAALLMALAMIVAAMPDRAWALTGIPGYYLDETAAVCGVCGYDYETMQPTVKSWLFNSTADGGAGTPPNNPNYPRFAAFRDTIEESVFGGAFNQFTGEVGNGYYSTVDGALYVAMKEAAQEDIENALAQYTANNPPSGGDSGPVGNTQNGDNVRIQLVKSFSSTAYITSNIKYNGVSVGFGPASTSVDASPDSIYIDVPNELMQRIRNNVAGDFKLIASVSTFDSVNLLWFEANQVEYEWEDLDLDYGNVTYPVRCLNEHRVPSARQYWCSFNLNGNTGITDVIQCPTNPNMGSSSMSAAANTYKYNGMYVSAVPYDGTYTPQPEPEPEPEVPTGPQVTIPEVPDEPIGPDTSGAAAPTVDTKPITDRQDIISGQIAEFEGLFWSFYNDVVGMFENLWNMLDFWLKRIEFNTRNTYVWLQSIYYALDNMGNEIKDTNDIYVPVVGNGNTVQTQLAEDAEQLKTKFPFSVPWDLYAMLLVLQAPPHSMIFDVPVAYFDQVETIHIDLSGFQEFYAACRAISLWSFAWWLLQRTRDLLVNWE